MFFCSLIWYMYNVVTLYDFPWVSGVCKTQIINMQQNGNQSNGRYMSFQRGSLIVHVMNYVSNIGINLLGVPGRHVKI